MFGEQSKFCKRKKKKKVETGERPDLFPINKRKTLKINFHLRKRKSSHVFTQSDLFFHCKVYLNIKYNHERSWNTRSFGLSILLLSCHIPFLSACHGKLCFQLNMRKMHKTQREAIALRGGHMPPACSCSLHGGVSLGNNIIKGKSTARTAVQLRPCKHQQFSPLIWVFSLDLYFSPTFIKDQGEKEETNVYSSSTCSDVCTESLNLTQFEVICVCMPPVTCLTLLHFYSRFLLYHRVFPFGLIINPSAWCSM